MRSKLLTASLVALAAGQLWAQPSAAETAKEQTAKNEQAVDIRVVPLGNWRYDDLYAGAWSADRMLDEFDVYGEEGEEIGSIENLIIGDDGQVLAIIAQVGGFWDIGDTHVSVPFDQVELAPGEARIPLTEDNADDYSIFGDAGFYYEETAQNVNVVDDDLETPPGILKATDLIGDYAYLSDNLRYGYVSDLLIRDGKVASVVVNAAGYGTPGYYAYPYTTHGWGRGVNGWRYDLPYTEDDVAGMDTFDYDQMKYNMGGSASGEG